MRSPRADGMTILLVEHDGLRDGPHRSPGRDGLRQLAGLPAGIPEESLVLEPISAGSMRAAWDSRFQSPTARSAVRRTLAVAEEASLPLSDPTAPAERCSWRHHGLLPSRGEVSYAGTPVARIGVEQRVALGLCLVPERRELFGAMTVSDNLELGAFQRYRAGDKTVEITREEVYRRFPRLASLRL